MTNTEAAWISGLIFLAVLADLTLNAGAASLFLLFKLLDLIDFVAFWH